MIRLICLSTGCGRQDGNTTKQDNTKTEKKKGSVYFLNNREELQSVYEEIAKANESAKENSIESYIITLPPASQTHKGSYGHIGREIGVILQGKAKLTYEGREYFLDEGDSVTFSAAVPHHLENIGDTELRAIWTVTPAQRFVK